MHQKLDHQPKEVIVVKIATWNLDRPKTFTRAKNFEIISKLKDIDADILILTETNFLIDPGNKYTPLSSDPLPVPGQYRYTHGENETTIWSKYPLSRLQTRNQSITVCAKVQTPNGDLHIYGTVIGVLGVVGNEAKHDFFSNLKQQIEEWKRIQTEEGNICIAGDFNVCWNGKGFPKIGRDEIVACFDELGILNLTHGVENNIDHIAISKSFLEDVKYDTKPETWNSEKGSSLSDHMGVCVTLELSKLNRTIEELEPCSASS